MPDPQLVQDAIAILLRRDPRRVMSAKEALDTLAEYAPFEDMDDDDLVPLAKAAMAQRGAAPPPAPAPRQGGGQHSGPVRTRPAPAPDQLTAPYRFVTVEDKVVLAQAETKAANFGFPIACGYSGVIEVDWAFETPMLIGVEEGPKDHRVSAPMKLGGDYVIPGASLRGMLRAAMCIVTRARLTQVNKNHVYGVRDFTHPLFKQGLGTGAARLAWNNPGFGAGWLRLKPATEQEKKQGLSDYVLTPCDKRIIRIRALPAVLNNGRPTNTGDWHRDWLGFKLDARYGKAGYSAAGKGRAVFDFDASKPTMFVPDPLAKSNDPTAPDHVIPGAGGRAGWFVFSSNSPSLKDIDAQTLDEQERSPRAGNQKKREYVFLDRPGAVETRLRQDVFERFERINSRPGKTKLKPEGSYGVMHPTLESGRRIPVFFAGDPAKQELGFDMGLTRLFKLPHANSVGKILERQGAHKIDPGKPDMVEALFGHVYDVIDLAEAARSAFAPPPDAPDEAAHGLARKGRIAFGFAKLLDETPAAETVEVTTVAMAPRASFAPFYLRGPVKDWTDEAVSPASTGKARLAGRKRYFARFPKDRLAGAENAVIATLGGQRGNDNFETQSRLRFLKPRAPGKELVFRGAIRLHNATPQEIGALLWTLTHGGDPAKPFRHLLGRGKNCGAGQARVRTLKLKLEANLPDEPQAKVKLAATPQDWEGQGEDGGWRARGGQSLAPFLQAFDVFMKTNADKQWPQVDDIREFLGASDPVKGATLPAAYLATPNDHGKLRKLVNANVTRDPAAVTRAGDRLLAGTRPDKVGEFF